MTLLAPPSARLSPRIEPGGPQADRRALRPMAHGPNDAEPPAAPRLRSGDLFGTGHEIEIAHAGSVYRLRITSLGKLILTK